MTLHDTAKELADLCTGKRAAYGDSIPKAVAILKVIYPDGLRPDQYYDALIAARDGEKRSRLAQGADAHGEDPRHDIAGYALMALQHAKEQQARWQDCANVVAIPSKVESAGFAPTSASARTTATTSATSAPTSWPTPAASSASTSVPASTPTSSAPARCAQATASASADAHANKALRSIALVCTLCCFGSALGAMVGADYILAVSLTILGVGFITVSIILAGGDPPAPRSGFWDSEEGL